MATRKPTRRRAVVTELFPQPGKLRAFKGMGVDLGALQSELSDASKALKSAGTKLNGAQDAFDKAKSRKQAASEKLAAASRAVLAEG